MKKLGVLFAALVFILFMISCGGGGGGSTKGPTETNPTSGTPTVTTTVSEKSINFMVDNKIYETIKTKGNETVDLPTPIKMSYIFIGWFYDKDTLTSPFLSTSLKYASLINDINVYAKFLEMPTETTTVYNLVNIVVKTKDNPDRNIDPKNMNAQDTAQFETSILLYGDQVFIGATVIYFNGLFFSRFTPARYTKNINTVNFEDQILKTSYTTTLDVKKFAIGKINSGTGVMFEYQPTYIVTLDRQGGTGGTNQVSVVTGKSMPKATAPTREGYIFAGYYESLDFSNQYYDAQMNSTRLWDRNGNSRIYARWQTKSYTIIFDKQGGIGGTNAVDVQFGDPMPKVTSPEKAGLIFYGYYDEQGNQYYDRYMNSMKNWDKAQDTILFAQWETSEHLILFDKQGGTGGTDSIYATIDSEMPEATAPTLTGQKFLGYFDALIGGTKYYDENMKGCRVWNKIKTTTLYALWDKNSYRVTLSSNDAYDTKEEVVAYYGLEMPKATKIPPYRNGYLFLGYFDEKSGGKIYYNANMSSANVWDKITDTTLYARWEREEDYITDGLKYTLINNNTEYSVSKGVATDQIIVVPTAYNGLPVTEIADFAFMGYNQLAYILIPEGIKRIGKGAFKDCSSLIEIFIPESVISIGEEAFLNSHFWNNAILGPIYLDKWLIGYKGNIIYTFFLGADTVGLSDKALYNSDIECVVFEENLKYIGTQAFDKCKNLKYFISDLNSFDENKTFKTFEGSLYTYDLKTIIKYASLFNGSFKAPDSLEIIGDYAFADAINLTTFTNTAKIKEIGNYAFLNCTGLTTIFFDKLEKIGEGAFFGCSGLTYGIILGRNVTSIGDFAFSGCINIASIWINSGVVEMGAFVFLNWRQNQRIYIEAKSAPLTWNFQPGWNAYCYASVHFDSTSVDFLA